MGRPPDDAGLVTKPFADKPLVMVASPDHPRVQEKTIPLQMLQDQTFVLKGF